MFARAWTHAYYVWPFFPRRVGVCKAGGGVCESCSRADAQSALQEGETRGVPNPADGPFSGLKKSNVHFQSQKAQPLKPKATIKPGLPPRIPSQTLRVPSTAPHPPPIQQKFQHQEEDPNRTPNVYINGLPAHLPEAELFELTSSFGAVRSVRCFTRHVVERAS